MLVPLDAARDTAAGVIVGVIVLGLVIALGVKIVAVVVDTSGAILLVPIGLTAVLTFLGWMVLEVSVAAALPVSAVIAVVATLILIVVMDS